MEKTEQTAKHEKGWNTIAIISVILWAIMIYGGSYTQLLNALAPVVLIGGIYSYIQIKKTGEKGGWLSFIAIFFGGIGTLGIASAILLIASR